MRDVTPAQCDFLAGIGCEVNGFVTPISIAIGFHIIANEAQLLPFTAIHLHIEEGSVDAVFGSGVVGVEHGFIVEEVHRTVVAPPEAELIFAIGRHLNGGRHEVGRVFHLVGVSQSRAFTFVGLIVGARPLCGCAVFGTPSQRCKGGAIKVFGPRIRLHRVVGLRGKRPHGAIFCITHAVVCHHFPVVGGSVIGFSQLIGSGSAHVFAIHHIEGIGTLSDIDFVALGELCFAPSELDVAGVDIGCIRLGRNGFTYGGHAVETIHIGEQHAVDEERGPFVNTFGRITDGGVAEAHTHTVGVEFRQVDGYINQGVNLGVICHPNTIVGGTVIFRHFHDEVVVRHCFAGEHAVVGESELLRTVGVAQIQARRSEIAIFHATRRVGALVAFNGVGAGAEAGLRPSCGRELVAFEEFEGVAIGHSLLVCHHLEGYIAAIGVEHHIGSGRRSERGSVSHLNVGGFVDTQIDSAQVGGHGNAFRRFKTAHGEAFFAHVFQLNHFGVALFADIHFGQFVARLAQFGDGAGERLVIFHANIVEIHNIGGELLQIVDEGNFDGFALISIEVEFRGVDAPVLPNVGAIGVGRHTTVAHIFFILNVENHGSVRRVSHIDDSHLEGHGAVVETRCSGSFPVESQLVGVVERHFRGDDVVFTRTHAIAIALIVGGRVAISVVVAGHRATGFGTLGNGPPITCMRTCILGDGGPPFGKLGGCHIRLRAFKVFIEQCLGICRHRQ